MLTEICQYLHNWFDRDQPTFCGEFTISDEHLRFDGTDMRQIIKDGQYIRISGSALNDGVHIYPLEDTEDETFTGTVSLMAVPKTVIQLANDIKAWQEKYGAVSAPAMSPYNSESFSGYSYSKTSGAGADGQQAGTWQSAFSARLKIWRKLR